MSLVEDPPSQTQVTPDVGPNTFRVSSITLKFPESVMFAVPPLEVPKVHIPQDFVGPFLFGENHEPCDLPARVPVEVSAGCEDLHLTLRIGSDKSDPSLGGGQASLVYAVDQEGDTTRLPPLAIKMARKSFNRFIAREAWFYDELASLQGSVVPRCFGLFSTRIPKDVISSWDEIRFDDYSLMYTDEVEKRATMKCPEDGLPLGDLREELLEGVCDSDHLTFLLLERLSKYDRNKDLLVANNGSEDVPAANNGSEDVPAANNGSEDVPTVDNGSTEDPEMFRKQCFGLSRCLADHGVHHGVLNLSDFMLPMSEWPSLPCPSGQRHAGYVFKWRILDFEQSRKHNKNIQDSDDDQMDLLYQVFVRPFSVKYVPTPGKPVQYREVPLD